MPFINVKTTVGVTDAQKANIVGALGKSVAVMHKLESHLMVGVEQNYSLFFGGKQLDKGAFVSVDTFGTPASGDCNKMTAEVCKILDKELGIPADKVYVKYAGTDDWGFNGSNF